MYKVSRYTTHTPHTHTLLDTGFRLTKAPQWWIGSSGSLVLWLVHLHTHTHTHLSTQIQQMCVVRIMLVFILFLNTDHMVQAILGHLPEGEDAFARPALVKETFIVG